MTSRRERMSPEYCEESAQIASIADQIIDDAQAHHRAETSVPPDQVSRLTPKHSNDEAINYHDDNLGRLTQAVQQAVHDRDLDRLRVYHKFNVAGDYLDFSNVTRIVNDLRSIGHLETLPIINKAMLPRAAKIWLDTFDEYFDGNTALCGKNVTPEERDSYIRTLRIACLVAPPEIIGYLMEDTERAMNIVGDRRITDHEDLISTIRSFLDSPAPVIAEGLL